VLNATTSSNEYKGSSPAVAGALNTFDVTNLNSLLTYYWRVDQLDVVNGATNLALGPVWEFRTRHLAFPGAEGYGRWARGGRGGRVIEVTNLNDTGPGSYRAAIAASGSRTIVFRVSGVIFLQSQCVIGNGYVTIAGQTAPGDGICIANYRAGMSSPTDVIMRYMRFRVGDHGQQAMDAMSTSSATHAIADHITSSWWLDVGVNALQTSKVGSEGSMVSYQHNILSEGLDHSYHYNDAQRAATGCTNCYGAHSLTASIGGEIGSYHHNLVSNTRGRNWDITGDLDQSAHYAGSVDLRNNVIYNWDGRTSDGGAARLQYVNNYYKSYPSNPGTKHLWHVDAQNTNWGIQYTYMVGNVMVGAADDSNFHPSLYFTNNWANGACENDAATIALTQTNFEMFPSYVDTQSATNAYKVVLSDSGCTLPVQDLIDKRVVGEVLDHTTHYIGTNGPTYTINGVLQTNATSSNDPGYIDSQTDVKDYSNDPLAPNYSPNWPWPPYYTYNVPVDTDHDGLPDWWERIKGLNTNSAAGDFSDANADLQGDGYTELDRYLNWMALPHYDCTNNTTLNVDLTQYTRGFTNLGPVYAVFNAAGGTVSLNGQTAQFTPNTGLEALGSFSYSVTDNTGFSYTNSINVHILSDGTSPTNPPAAPTGLIATAGNVQVTLSWTSSSGATSYHVWRSTNSGSGYATIGTTSLTGFIDGGVANGTTYYYVVSALNVVGESTNSTEVSATPALALPGAPTGLTAAPGNTQVSLTWFASSGATGYYVKRSTTSGSGYVNIATNTVTGLVDTSVTNGTTYYYVVSAINAAGESTNSTQVNATPRIPAPTGLTAAAGNGQVSLSWTGSAGATAYIAKRATVSGGPYTSIVTNGATSFVDTNVLNGTTYFYVVVGVDNGGIPSLNSSQVFATPVGTNVGGLIYYDGFNYAGFNSINLTNNGGTGWGNNPWNDKNNLTVINATSLSYTDSNGNVLATTGGSITDSNTSSTQTMEPQRLFSSSTTVTLGTLAATNNNTLWMSFLWKGLNTGGQGTGGNSYRQATLMFLQGATTSQATGSEYLDLGIPNINNNGIPRTFSLWDSHVITGGTSVSSTAPIQSTVAANTGSPIFVLVQMTVDNSATTTDTINVWLNPPLGVGVGSLGTANITFSGQDLSAVNALRFQSSPVNGTYNVGGQMTVDELRLGNSLASVTPFVAAGNTAPVLGAISNRTINVGVNLLITNNAADSDLPAQTLSFSLLSSVTNAAIDTNSGVFTWRPLVTQADTTNQFSIVVADNGSPALSATQSFVVGVNPLSAPSAASVALSNGLFGFTINGQSGPDYGVLASTNLVDWNLLFMTNSPALPFNWVDPESSNAAMRFYRVKLGPPLP
jgi:fibronectin type 3 domain-containing protein